MDILQFLLLLTITALFLVLTYMRSNYFIHMAQEHGYIIAEYKKWVKDFPNKAFIFRKNKPDFKKELVYTPRVKRLFITQTMINFLLMFIFLLLYLIFLPTITIYVLLVLAMLFVGIVLIFYQNEITSIALSINSPIEKMIHRKFYKQAQKKIDNLKSNGLKVIGITGSFGKTSTKMILYHILKDHIKTYTSPESYNTPMGLSKVINNELSEEYDVFIAEMGARYVNEIEELTKLTKPDMGIITNIGPSHLGTFGSMDNIVKTKFELADWLEKSGYLVVNYDNIYIRKEISKRTQAFDSVSISDEDATISADIIEVGEYGTKFNIHFPEETIEASTPLLGEHSISNILMSTLIAKKLGIPNDKIVESISKLPQVEHRLSVIKNQAGLVIIDDAFNSNPTGAMAALKVMNSFKNGKKVIVTPGMVELGDLMYDENYKLGQAISKMTNISILVGKEITKPIQEGIKSTENPNHESYVVNSLKEATALFSSILVPGDVVLFENDLTDIY